MICAKTVLAIMLACADSPAMAHAVGICKKSSPPPLFAFAVILLSYACGLYIVWIGWMRVLGPRDKRGFMIVGAGAIGVAIGLYGLFFNWWDACFWEKIVG